MMRFISRRANPSQALCHFSTSSLVKDGIVGELKQTLQAKRDVVMAKIKQLKKLHGEAPLSSATLDSAYGGMRNITGLVYEPSLIDKNEGIRFRGFTIPECRERLPKAAGFEEPLPEGMLWLLLTGTVPTAAQVELFRKELCRRAQSDALDGASKVIQTLPRKMHPMTQFSIGILSMQHSSIFAEAYSEGKANKDNYWELALEDMLNCIARTPAVAAMIYRRFTTGVETPAAAVDDKLDWSANFCRMIGFEDPKFWDCMRLYFSIHMDHEGGNVSAHTTSLVGSTLADPYLSLSAGMNGLAGPLHGLANQECLDYLQKLMVTCTEKGVSLQDREALKKAVTDITWNMLQEKKVIPGYGHAVLRKTDPRYTCLREFSLRHLPDDDLFRVVEAVYEVMPNILTQHGKVQNPYPNVDGHSGVVLQHFGLTEQDFYTVLFGLSRQMGVLTGVVWDRLEGRPIERPKSTTTDALCAQFKI